METQFYEDSNPWLNKKKSMTLDLDIGIGKTRKSILSTPDVQMLKLASPELEKMIINQQGNVCTTPTPTQFICPKNVTDEQAAFAQGFVEALQSLHSTPAGSQAAAAAIAQMQQQGLQQQPTNLAVTTDAQTGQTYTQVSVVQSLPQATAQQQVLPQNSVVVSSHSSAPPSYANLQTTTTLPGGTPTSVNYHQQARNSAIATTVDASALNGWPVNSRVKQEHHHVNVMPIEQPQTVPVFHGSPPMSPIDMETQERIKAERKKLRNRVAASKCRKRKLERIARLEDKVKDLKTQNSDLIDTASKLREQVCALKQGVMEHVKNGCQVMLAQQLAF